MKVFFAATTLACLSVAHAQPLTQLQSVADSVLSETGAPAAGVAWVTRDGERSVAVAGVRRQDAPDDVTPNDLWHLGSNTKAMTATLAARLVKSGVIDWETTLGEALSDLELEIRAEFLPVTLADLLHHRSGLPANLGRLSTLRFLGSDDSRDVQEDRLRYAEILLAQAPTQSRGAFLYSNAGYVIAALMMEQAAGESYETLMQEEVFSPLGMESAGWGPPGEMGANDQPRGHGAGLFGGLSVREPDERADNPPVLNSAGRAHMSLDDVLDFLQAHLGADDGPYLSARSWEVLHRPVGEEAYAMGWGVTSEGALGHSGSNTMWLIRARIDPSQGRAAAAVVNDGRVQQASPVLGRALTQVLAAETP